MVLHHVSDDAGLVIVSTSISHRQRLGHGDLNTVDIIAVPDWLEYRVGEPKYQQILNRLFSQVVVNAVDLALVEDLLNGAIQLLGGREVVSWLRDPTWTTSQRYLDDDSDVVVTEHVSRTLGLRVRQTAFVRPDRDVLVLHFAVTRLPGGPIQVIEHVEATSKDGVLFDLKLTLPVFDQDGSGSRRDDAEVVAPDKTEYQGIFGDGPGTLLIVSCFADVCQTDARTATFEVHYWVESALDPLPAGISLIGG